MTEIWTTIDYDWSRNARCWRGGEGLAIPVVDSEDRRGLVSTLKMDARGINNGWVDAMPVERTQLDLFVNCDDPRNANPPLNVDEW